MKRSVLIAWIAALLVVACGNDPAPPAAPSPSAGQVAPASTAPKVSFYAASRFAEQATFGPTPALVAEIQAKGFETWIDDQFALPPDPIDVTVAEGVDAYGINQACPVRLALQLDINMVNKSLSAPDQLRWRVAWSLSEFVVAATS